MLEVKANFWVGLVTAWFGNVYLAPLVGVTVSHKQSVALVAMFTVMSIVRQYVIRRAFNAWDTRIEESRKLK